VPDSVLAATARPTIDHRGPDFARLVRDLMPRLQHMFGTSGPVLVYPASGTGAWEAALVNTLSPGDRVLAFDTGHFAVLWSRLAEKLGLAVELVPATWRRGVDPNVVGERLAADAAGQIKAVLVVHNETSTGVTSRVPEIRAAMDASEHPALLLVDTISSLGSIEYRHNKWGVDVTVGGSQKGLMLPPGLGFNAVSPKALDSKAGAGLARAYWDWEGIIEANKAGAFPSTPATNLLFGLEESLTLLEAEGLANVWERHDRHAEATRRAVRTWGLELLCEDEREYSSSLTAVLMPPEHDADAVREIILDRFDMSLGAGLGRLKGTVFRIGHLGDFNDLALAGTLCGVEMGLRLAGVPVEGPGVETALAYLEDAARDSGAVTP
jgi:alanine-glyoxylate transaminase/serine-glyoxylate transaminase/serine-pyruvate transaminase